MKILVFLTFDLRVVVLDSWGDDEMLIRIFLSIISKDDTAFRIYFGNTNIGKIHPFVEQILILSHGILGIVESSSNHCETWLIIMELWWLKHSHLMSSDTLLTQDLGHEIQTTCTTPDDTNLSMNWCFWTELSSYHLAQHFRLFCFLLDLY